MKLTNEEFNQFKATIDDVVISLHYLFFLKIDLSFFEQQSLNLDKENPNNNYQAYIPMYKKLMTYAETELKNDLNSIKKLKLIVIDCFNKDVSQSFLSLLKSTLGVFDTREHKAILYSLQQYNISRQTPSVSSYWKIHEVLNRNIDTTMHNLVKSLDSLFVFDEIKYVTSNMVLVGANGSGKSRFSRQIARSKMKESPIVIIPAQHILGFQDFNSMENQNFDEIIQNNDQMDKIGIDFHLIQYDFQNLIKLLQTNYNYCARTGQKSKCLFNKVAKIFRRLILTRKLIFDNKENIPKASTFNGHSYSINEMSDGEKSILYFIVHVLNAKQNSFIIIDEPENHMHYDACINLWNLLENERNDCTFLYLTHNIDFALSRINTTFIWNKGFEFPNKWKVEVLKENSLPKKVYLEILGTVPPILYCEGETGSIDKETFEVIYPDFLVKECGGCQIVREYKIAIHDLHLEKNKKIYAVVDKDFKSQQEIIKGYTKHGINVLKVLEIENLYFVPELASIMFGVQFDKFKEEYFKLCIREKEKMINERLKVSLQHSLNKIKSKSFMDKYEKNPELRLTLAVVRKERKAIEKEFESIISSRDYDQALIYFDLKKALFDLADRFIISYKDHALNFLRTNRSICKKIAEKYVGIKPNK